MVKVKICGITNKEDALASVEAGCDGLGFVFYRKSPRYISPEKAWEIISLLPPGIVKIGVFVNSREKSIKNIARRCSLDMLQFHGRQTPEFCRKFPGYKLIKVFRVKDKIRMAEVSRYSVFAYLFDTFNSEHFGGTGRIFDWTFLNEYRAALKKTVFLAGGLNELNVSAAVKGVKPDWVDASSCLETKPGRKDHRKVKKFIVNAKSG